MKTLAVSCLAASSVFFLAAFFYFAWTMQVKLALWSFGAALLTFAFAMLILKGDNSSRW